MQKIAPSEAIMETLKEIETGRNKHGYQVTPDEAIEQAIMSLDESVTMWNENRGGKPRSTDRYDEPGWLLGMKNFPNKLLPYLTGEQIAIALGVQNDETICQLIDQSFAGWAASTDWERLIYPDMKRRLADYPDLLAKVEHLVNPPACTACPFYIRMDGSHYCGMKTCHTRKTAAWHEQILIAAVKDLGIPLYDKKDGKYQVMTYEHEKIFAARNKDLRLIRRGEVRGNYIYQHLKGVEDAAFLVVMTGKTLQDKTTAVKEARADEKAQMSAEHKKSEMLLAARIRLYWESTIYLANMFAAVHLDALETLIEVGYAFDVDLPEDVKEPAKDQKNEYRAQFLRRQIVMAMLDEKDTFNLRSSWKTAAAVAAWLQETSQSWGVKLPRAFFKVAEQLDEELAAVTAETPKKKGKGRVKA
jgi:hypothetical protein